MGESPSRRDRFRRVGRLGPGRPHEDRHVVLTDAPKTWNTPALAGNRLFLRKQLEMACDELPAADGSAPGHRESFPEGVGLLVGVPA